MVVAYMATACHQFGIIIILSIISHHTNHAKDISLIILPFD